MKSVVDALKDWLASNDHPSSRFKGAAPKLQVVFQSEGDAVAARHTLLREIAGDGYLFNHPKGGLEIAGIPVEFKGPFLKIEL